MSDKKNRVKRIFDSISPRYDLLNHLLSAYIDVYWRKKALKLLKLNPTDILLDVACGTGDFALEASKTKGIKIFGADLSFNMLSFFNKKSKMIRGKLVQSVAEYLPYRDSVFNVITVAFGVRNFYDIPEGFNSFHRVLIKGGKVCVLEFRLPEKGIFRTLYRAYFTKVLPIIGKIISKDNEAYKYLPDSVHEFDEKVNLKELFLSSGFKAVHAHSLTFGIVQVIIAEK